MRRKGFTLVECLIGMALSLVVIAAGLEVFSLAQGVFSRLKEREEAGQAALAAIDRMRIDLLHAGLGLAAETALGLVEAVRATDNELRTTSLEKRLALAADGGPGDTRILLKSAADIAAGQEVVLRDGMAGEVRTVAGVDRGAIVLDGPLAAAYPMDTASVSLLENVRYFLDGPRRVLRRRVNAGSAQPVLESVSAAIWRHDPEAFLVRVRLELGIEGAQPHEATVFLKNPALAGICR
jgi:prepilin-type N-terminal cleavage/methylation domain-containing protein